MSRSLISGRKKRTASSHNRVNVLGLQLRFRGANRARRNWVTIESSRLISARAMSIDSCSSRLSSAALSFFTFRSINCRWMWSELSGLPISCATPAASKVRADKRSDSIVCWVERRLSVMSRRIMACPTASATAPSASVVRHAPLDDQRHDIEIDEAVRRIENFHVAAERGVGLRKRFPIEPPHLFVERFADRVFAVEPEDFAGGVIQIGDAAFRIGHDDPFLDGVENRLEKTFFLREAEQIILHLLRPDAAEAADEFFQETGFHRSIVDARSVRHRERIETAFRRRAVGTERSVYNCRYYTVTP